MNSVRLLNTPNILWVLSDRSCLKLYSLEEYIIQPKQMYIFKFKDMQYNCDSNVIGIPFKDKEVRHSLSLYNPEGTFAWRGGGEAFLATKNISLYPVNIKKGTLLGKINFMTTQFFELMRLHDNSDRGLRSAHIKIELRYDNK